MPDRRLNQALGRLLDGEPEPDDGPLLAEAMRSDPAFANEVRRLLVVDDLLRQHAEPDADAFVDALALRTGGEPGRDLAARLEHAIARPTESSRRWTARLPWLVATVACVAAAAVLLSDGAFRRGGEDRPDVASVPAVPVELDRGAKHDADRESVVALLVNEVGAEFRDGAAPDAVRFPPGEYELTNGAIHLRFASGADVVIPSPARFSIRDRLHMALESGSLRVLASSSAYGFTVDAPGVAYEDLGTEFGVSVAAGRSQSEVHVFEGAVDVKSPDGRTLSSLTIGESASVADGRIGPAGPPDPALFPTPADIGLLRWRRWRDRLRTDPTLVCYYPFEERAGDPSVLADAAGALDGRIRGARWVSGRWPGKQALLFDQPGDAVEVALPGEHRQMTIAAWVRVERLDFELNAVFNSDGWEAGDLHLQLNRSGLPQVGFHGNHGRWGAGPAVAVGGWTHLATVIDLDRNWSGVYLNGALVVTTPITAPHFRLAPGPCRIGDWLRRPDWDHAPERGFRGRIDEFAVWNRALTAAEIRKHVEAGRPSLLATVAEIPPQTD